MSITKVNALKLGTGMMLAYVPITALSVAFEKTGFNSLAHIAILSLISLATYIAIMGYGYGLFRKQVAYKKASWYTVLVSTIAFSLHMLAGLFIFDAHKDLTNLWETNLGIAISAAIVAFSMLYNFCLSLVIVFFISKFYQRRVGFEVE